ncbi:MFS transporter [Scleromatobacter humisilvae]|uniref:MFS transporter n=1 Tax=Scleromatobacter humisilvae TaxID=2897159 RepID=A0A9X2C201_9BURK|nr:MFS transporter [Scleromatobacter humisilvae]MCK9689403.1 MFS transporter [Scleromatobacter humisilvae]
MSAVLPTYAERNEPYWQRNLLVCVFGSFTTLVSLSMLLPFLPIYVEQLGVHGAADIVQWSSFAYSATFIGTAVTSPIWGRLSDSYGRKIMLVRAAVGMAILMSLIGTANSAPQLVMLRFLAGLVGGYGAASIVMIGSQVPQAKAGWALGVLSTGALCGNLIGPLVGGFLPELVGIRGSFFLGGGLIAIAAVATILLVKEDFSPVSKSHLATVPKRRPKSEWLAILALLLASSMVLLASMSVEPIITIYIQQLGVDKAKLPRYAGFIMSATAFASMLAAPKIGALADRIGGWRVITVCLIATALVLVPQAWVVNWWQLCGLRFLMGLTIAGLLPAIGKLIRGLATEGSSGSLLGTLQSAQFVGQVVGPLIGGQVGARVGMGQVFYVTATMLIFSAAAVWACRPRH